MFKVNKNVGGKDVYYPLNPLTGKGKNNKEDPWFRHFVAQGMTV